MKRLRRSLLFLTLVIVAGCAASSMESECVSSGTLHAESTSVLVSSADVCVPEGVFLALRKGGWEGAVRFVNVRDVNAARLEGCARYEIYTRNNRNSQLTMSSGVVSAFDSVGVHPIVVQRGNQTITGPGISLRYAHPGCLWLLGQPQLEAAPTPWRTIEEVDLGDERLRWYRLDPSGSRSLTISLDELTTVFDQAVSK